MTSHDSASDRPAVPVQLTRTPVFRDSMAVVMTTGAYGISFGAIAAAGGLNVLQTVALSLLMFSGGSQFGLVGVIAGGGSPWAGAATAIMLGSRNLFYGLRLSGLLRLRGWRRLLGAQVVIDESSAMSLGRRTEREARIGFYATGIGIYLCWNLGTLIGVVGASTFSDPLALGLDAAAPAAFLALLAPRLRGREPWAIALAAAALALACTPITPPGVPVLLAAAFGIAVGFWPRRRRSAAPENGRRIKGAES